MFNAWMQYFLLLMGLFRDLVDVERMLRKGSNSP